MEVFVHRQPKGFITSQLADIEELRDLLANFGPLGDDDEVTVEITAPWRLIRELLSQPMFSDAWFSP
ncbi:unnamed protein product [marine sediment metagenome]|uniref:Uncharacterized protein n=1 Tax=marine sediment metagenome TaxID=412755 RepID=X1KYC8_9ZZZZ